MELLDKIILTIHIAAGSISLLLFWIPIFVKKGSKSHVLVGKWYISMMWIVLISSLMLSLINAIQGYIVVAAFLSYLALLTGGPLWYGIVIVKYKKSVPIRIIKIKTGLSYALFIFGIVLIGWSALLSFKGLSILLLIFGLIGTLSSIGSITQPLQKVAEETNWLFEHVSGMIISGIAAYTAFFAFGGSQYLSEFLPGPLGAIPWVLPNIIGITLIKRYKKSILKSTQKTNTKITTSMKTTTSRSVLTALTFLFICNVGYTQMPYEEHGNTRFAFAQTTVGADFRYTPILGTSASLNSSGEVIAHEIGGDTYARFNITGLHFWGKFDFYVSIPVVRLSGSTFADDGSSYFDNGVETGLRYFPWRMTMTKLRPYVGISFNNLTYIQEEGDVKHQTLSKNTYPLQAGLNYATKKGLLFDLGITYNYNQKYDYFISKTQTNQLNLPPLSLHAGVRKIIDTSIFGQKNLDNGNLAKWTQTFIDSGKANSLSFAIGISSPFYLRNSFNSDYYPYLGDMRVSTGFIDWGLGYYLHKPDLHFNIAYRNYQNTMVSFDTELVYSRRSIGFECYKFIGDYHGFVPFVGPIISYDTNQIDVTVGDVPDLEIDDEGLKVGLTFGWDIRPTEIEAIILRTNLRLYPGYNIDINGVESKFTTLEFNFIQAVFYPGRFKARKKVLKYAGVI